MIKLHVSIREEHGIEQYRKLQSLFYPKHFLFTEDSSKKACFNHSTWTETPPGRQVLVLPQSIQSLPRSAVSNLSMILLPQSHQEQNTPLNSWPQKMQTGGVSHSLLSRHISETGRRDSPYRSLGLYHSFLTQLSPRTNGQ